VDVTLQDLPLNQAEKLRNRTAERKLYTMGQKWSGDGEGWVNTAKETASRNGLPLYYVVNTIEQENKSFNPALKSTDPKSSAAGLGQFVKGTANELKINPYDPYESIKGVGDYMGQIKKTQGLDNYEDIRKAYVLGPTGYKKHQQGEHVAGEEYLPNIDKYLVQNGLKNGAATGGLATIINAKQSTKKEVSPNSGPQEFEGPNWFENKGALQAFLAHPKRIMEEIGSAEKQVALREERDKLMHTPISALQNLQSIQTL